MILTLDTERLRTLDEVRAFLDGNGPVDFRRVDRDDAYELVRRTLVRFRYGGLCGPATRRVLQRQFEVYGDIRFERLAGCRTATSTGGGARRRRRGR